jgi:hypothetical protein
LPFHPLGADKYLSLGMDCPISDLRIPSLQTMQALAEAARSAGITVVPERRAAPAAST